MSASRTWRLRSCPSCGYQGAAGTFALVGDYRPHWQGQPQGDRACPKCGHIGRTSDFKALDLGPMAGSIQATARRKERLARRRVPRDEERKR